jgi:hypothetical protein
MLSIDDLPGFRRRFVVSPTLSSVRSVVEDDYHFMSVTLHHDGAVVTAVEPVLTRAPWTTCPGAVSVLERTFIGEALDSFVARGLKTTNCTHLYDLAILAAAHARDTQQLTYDVLVADPVGGQRRAELRRNGSILLSLIHVDGRIIDPPELDGATLLTMRSWIESLNPQLREAARIFQWGTILALGRTIPLEDQSDASQMGVGKCYTMQPNIVTGARRVGEIRDFTDGTAQLLDRSEGASVTQASGESLPHGAMPRLP